ncbi:hypothetical protein PLESTB_001131600 [Pleodorina starrii]|uniref:Methyltransferase domain-containing protein n=1 Tax=Pleodorina starrii TaxID=330485 RepID=A0A9W6F5R0_9CHLO|nr:hypothetical protein PLESTM_001369000 [Pleodorina starrii]GLC56656.1 hypothetical protein PLESTB_001131600 [Pleodorina starrii]GLC69043.1 hypothetical protein PLESTF_000773500 [Pleodorina starrii]
MPSVASKGPLAGILFEMRTWVRCMLPYTPYVAPFYPTPDAVISRVLDLTATGPGDVLYDLGCGDGRVLLAAARRGARCVGYELDPQLAADAEAAASAAGLAARVRVVRADAAAADVREATVIALYLSDHGNSRLLRAVQSSLRPGTRVASFYFPVALPGWSEALLKADRTDGLAVYVYKAP